MTTAAMSRMASHSAPMWLRIRFLATIAKTTRKPRHSRYFSTEVLRVLPNTLRLKTETETDDELIRIEYGGVRVIDLAALRGYPAA